MADRSSIPAPSDATEIEAAELVDEGTVVVDRAAPVEAPVDDGTVVVDRAAPAPEPIDEGTVVVDRAAPAPEPFDEGTVVVDRAAPAEEPIDDGTVVVDRAAPVEEAIDEGTVVVDRAAPTDDGTIIVDRSTPSSAADPEPSDDGTIVVERAGAHAAPSSPEGDQPVKRTSASALRLLTRRGRRALTPAPVDPAMLRPSVVAPGPGAIDPYVPRQVPEPAAPPVPLAPTPEATRVVDASLPSAELRSRRTGLIALGAVALAGVVSVVGLIAIAVAAFSGAA